MNVSAIAQMIQADPTILSDVPGFIARMNAMTQQQTVTAPVVVQQAVVQTTSIAQMNGGPCSAADVQAAQNVVNQAPFSARLPLVMAAVQADINAGLVTSLATLKTSFQNAVAALS